MGTIAIINNKGGVGKTTSAQNIGAAIATFTEGKKRVLVIDLDPQGNLTESFGIELPEDAPTVGSFILRKATLEQTVFTYKESNIDILPAADRLFDDEDEIKASSKFPFNIKQALAESQQKYDFVVIDCPPSTRFLIHMALAACDRYYIPLQAAYLSYGGLAKFITNYANKIVSLNPSMRLGGVFATRFNPKANKRFSRELIEYAKHQLGDRFLDSYIRENGDLDKAQAKGQHIFDYNAHSNGALDYHQLTKEIITKQ
jgi:chromosome partitioning protein